MIEKQYKNPKRKSIQKTKNVWQTKIWKWKLFLSISTPFYHLNFREEKKNVESTRFGEFEAIDNLTAAR